MDNKMSSINRHQVTIQVPAIIGRGEKQELVTRLLTISPPSPPVFRIKDIDKEVVITNTVLVPEAKKVIIDGYIDKNINYKTIAEFTEEAVDGPLDQFTTRIEFATFVIVNSLVPLRPTDQVEILSASVEGEKDELMSPNSVPVGAPSWAVTYNQLLEKMIVKITLKITRIEDIPITPASSRMC
jgi:hypothetical protein